MVRYSRRFLRRFVYKDSEGDFVDCDMTLPHITLGKRQRQCRGVYPNDKGGWIECHRIISRKIPTLTINGKVGRKINPHHYCPRCSEMLLENIKRKIENNLEIIRKAKISKKNIKDEKLSEERWKWETIFH